MLLNNFVGYGKAQACPLGFGCEKRIEYILEILTFNAASRVYQFNNGFIAFLSR
jgi:hypothetical protein